jgi:hypothetical protein
MVTSPIKNRKNFSRFFQGLVLVSGSERKQVFQSLHDIRLVKSLLSPGPLIRDATRTLTISGATKALFANFRQLTGQAHNEGAGGKVFLTKRISWSD